MTTTETQRARERFAAHTPSIVDLIADALDAHKDSRGFSAEHLRATRLANAAPALLGALKLIEKMHRPTSKVAQIARAALAQASGEGEVRK